MHKMNNISILPKIDFLTDAKGNSKAVVLGINEWRKILETLKIISNKELLRSIKTAQLELRRGNKLFSLKEVIDHL